MSTKQNKNKRHIFFMGLALRQAMINLGCTKTNPSVGCVITKNGTLISAGRTSLNGRPHAEYNAISNSKKKFINSNLYVTLEPCSHYGKTPPCVQKIIRNKIKKVHFSIKDPDTRSFDKSRDKLKKFNVAVNIGVSSKRIKNFYKSYILFKKKKLPFVTCKLAISRDYYTINRGNKWITNKYSRGRVHLMRSNHDCIMTSSKTVIKDNPQLNCRIKGLENRSPARILLDNHLKIPINSKIVKDSIKYKTIIFYNEDLKRKIQLLNKLGVKTYKIPINNDGNLNLEETLLKARQLGFYRIFLETGIKLSCNFLKANLINDLKIFVSSKKLNKNGRGNIKKELNTLLKKKKYQLDSVNLFTDKLITYKIK